MQGLTRRELAVACAAVACSGGRASAETAARAVELPHGGTAPVLGQGSWHLAQGRHPAAEEEEALRTGISLGMTLLDTAEIYSGRPFRGDGRPRHRRAAGQGVPGLQGRCPRTPRRAASPPPARPASGVSAPTISTSTSCTGANTLWTSASWWRPSKRCGPTGRIRRWGVSNFRVADMEDLFRVRGGDACATNQVRYNLMDRSIERDLLPWCERHGMPIMAYSPLGNGNEPVA